MNKIKELRKLNKDDLYSQKYKRGKRIPVPREYKDAYIVFQDAIGDYMALVERMYFYEGFHYALEMLEREEENNGK